MLAYRTPGVYFEWLDARAPAIVPLRTDIAGFVGIAAGGPLERKTLVGPKKVAVRVESFTQFTSIYGGHTPQGYLSYAVEGFFANGGQTCWVVRVADRDKARSATRPLTHQNGEAVIFLSAICRIPLLDGRWEVCESPGTWGDNITATLIPEPGDRFTLIVSFFNAREIWRDLSLDADDPRNVEKLINNTLAGSNLVSAKIELVSAFPVGTLDPPSSGLRGRRLRNGSDGLENSLAKPLIDDMLEGLSALELIDEISIVTMPDIMPKNPVAPTKPKEPPHDCSRLDRGDFADLYGNNAELWPTLDRCVPKIEPATPEKKDTAVEFPPAFNGDQIRFLQRSLVGHCEKLKDRVAVLDAPNIHPDLKVQLTPELAEVWRRDFDTKYAALYFPWLRVPDSLQIEGLLRSVPPSGHVAGIYARGDRRVGVHKPPANEELEGVKDVQVAVEDAIHGALNDRGINVIRTYRGRGVRVAGARTLSSSAEWRYVNVRRLLIMIEEAIDEQTQWTVFEPNNPDLWREIDRVARSFLQGIWRRGMLDGATAEEAYSVRCDETTNPPEETDAGRVTCEIGVLPPWPAEFVVVRIGKTEGGTEIIESTR